ncbi:MAG: class I SAM-dependent methyltransferase [Pirellula sp.]|jgi:16S rRNA (guanine1207-N2)-methyltransferase|nr:class I SAM-dependent methyltransferase [Pirellula sp.]
MPPDNSAEISKPMEHAVHHVGLIDEQSSSLPIKRSPRVEERALCTLLQQWDWNLVRKKCNLDECQEIHIVSVSSGRHQAAELIAKGLSDVEITCWHIDSFQASRTSEQFNLDDTNAVIPSPKNLHVICSADLPAESNHLAILSLITTGEAELSRDYIQQLYHHLVIGGQLIVSVDNADDRWVHEQLKGYEKSVKVRPQEGATVYWIEKTAPLKKLKDFSCELAYRDCDDLIRLVTRPGVFSHRQLDNGARQLLDAVDVYPEARLIDIGCGSGSVALGLAKRDPKATIHAVDANARAIDCLHRGMVLNEITNITTEVNPTGVYGQPESYDMALANPPYFGDFRIAEKFIAAAQRSLRAGGRIVLVHKQPKWYEENLQRWFVDCEVFPSKRYFIASGIKG